MPGSNMADVSAVKFGQNIKPLFRWRGSIYKLVWKEFVIYTLSYVTLSIVYDFALDEGEKRGFEDVAAYCSTYTSSVPIILLLGFFTSTSMQRWFSLINSMPGTTKVIASFVMSVKENQPEGPSIIQQYARWVILGWALTFRLVCKPFKKAFPDLISLQNAGILQTHERLQLEAEPFSKQPLIVLQWKLALLRLCNRKGIFIESSDYGQNLQLLIDFKKSGGNTIKFAVKNVPFAMIQAVTITVYSFGLASLMARQLSERHSPSSFIIKYFPVLNTFQYFLYYLWLKFGRMAAYPFADEENGIDIKGLFQSHLQDAVRWQSLYLSPESTEQLVMRSLDSSSHQWMDSPRNPQLATNPDSESIMAI